MYNLIIAQFVLLLMGTLFAWGNFGLEMVNWRKKKVCTTGCAVGLVHPVKTPCFYGAICFTIALVLSWFMLSSEVL